MKYLAILGLLIALQGCGQAPAPVDPIRNISFSCGNCPWSIVDSPVRLTGKQKRIQEQGYKCFEPKEYQVWNNYIKFVCKNKTYLLEHDTYEVIN